MPPPRVLRVRCLGAGRDVGRSCVLVTLGTPARTWTLLFDAGMHMGFADGRRWPDFNSVAAPNELTARIDAVVVTHFHLDHCGALPVLVGAAGYDGPIYMTHPTRAMLPLMLEDFLKVASPGGGGRGAGDAPPFSKADIQKVLRQTVSVGLHASTEIAPGLTLVAHYAGHVLGAAMFTATGGGVSVSYTGDYNTAADRHLGPAALPRCPGGVPLDLLITESTYATTVRGPKRAREGEFVDAVVRACARGGKVLVPVFALGRAQELMCLLDDAWARLGLTYPIYYSAGMTARANAYYNLLTGWAAERVRGAARGGARPFAFTRMAPFRRGMADTPGPCILFATPGMLHGGQSLEVFKAWAPDATNLIVLPGYCVSGTVGAKLMAGPVSRVEVDKRGTTVDVRAGVRYLSFSAHADARGICDLVRGAAPAAVMLVHGEGGKMDTLAAVLEAEAGVARVIAPANGEDVDLGDVCARGGWSATAAETVWARGVPPSPPTDPGAAADAGWRPAPPPPRVVDVEWVGDGAGGVKVVAAATQG